MTVKKLAISLPEDVLALVDDSAKRKGMTRSGFIAAVLRQVAGARRDADVTRRLNALFADEAVALESVESAAQLLAARRTEGTEW